MIHIRRIEPHEWLTAKRVVYRVALPLFGRGQDLEEFIAYHEAKHELKDMDDIEKSYLGKGGTFLVMFDGEEMICTGAIRPFEGESCELKRLWLLPEYHGQGLGYRMLQELLTFARAQGYTRIQSETDAVAQSRAVDFYKRIGFREVPIPNQTPDEDILMELEL